MSITFRSLVQFRSSHPFNDEISKFNDLSVYNLWILSMVRFIYFTDIYVCINVWIYLLCISHMVGRTWFWCGAKLLGRKWNGVKLADTNSCAIDFWDYSWCVKRPNIFMWLSFREGYKGTSANEKIEFKFLETFELSSLWFIINLSR